MKLLPLILLVSSAFCYGASDSSAAAAAAKQTKAYRSFADYKKAPNPENFPFHTREGLFILCIDGTNSPLRLIMLDLEEQAQKTNPNIDCGPILTFGGSNSGQWYKLSESERKKLADECLAKMVPSKTHRAALTANPSSSAHSAAATVAPSATTNIAAAATK